ncbi:MAG TPA: M20/M25/M40 family metallo-hydrolase [Actinoplanes sp.]|jgi:LysW-gamma-L-lysine carboxypeptidase|nr:M20/M25/M40 family metallo-hydrolase [Actinoplanes sp.]
MSGVPALPAAGADVATCVALLRAVVGIASPSGAEEPVAREYVRWMTELGLRAGLDHAGNAIGETGPAGAPTVVLLGHLDTVPGEVPVRWDGSLLYGRGTVDAKGPLSAMVCAAARVGPDLPVRLVVIGAVDEERESIGARAVVHAFDPAAVIVGEPSGADAVVIGYKGLIRLAVDVIRPAAHSSTVDPKAVEVAADLWQRIRQWLPVDPDRPWFTQALPTLIRLDGDGVRARLTLSCRTPVGFDHAGFLRRVTEAAGADRVTVIESTAAVLRPRTDPVARALCAAIRRSGATPRTKVKLGTADMNVVAPYWPVPTATYGPGDSSLDHTDAEHIDVNEYLRAIDVLAGALRDIASDVLNPAQELSR